jgi:hypothetical protein
MVGSYSVHLEATIRRVIQFCCTHATDLSHCPVTSGLCRLLWDGSVAVRRSKVPLCVCIQHSSASLLSLLSLLRTPPRGHNPQIHPHHSIKMCFRASTSVESSSSSSSDEPIARVIDLPTVRHLNSPRCAVRGNAYRPGAEAASERPSIRPVDGPSTTAGESRQ